MSWLQNSPANLSVSYFFQSNPFPLSSFSADWPFHCFEKIFPNGTDSRGHERESMSERHSPIVSLSWLQSCKCLFSLITNHRHHSPLANQYFAWPGLVRVPKSEKKEWKGEIWLHNFFFPSSKSLICFVGFSGPWEKKRPRIVTTQMLIPHDHWDFSDMEEEAILKTFKIN